MSYDLENLKRHLINILTTPSVTGSTDKVMSYIKNELNNKNLNYSTTNKGNILITIEGEDKSSGYERLFSGHVDTLGSMVKEIKSNGTLAIVPVGGFMMNSVEGENCLVETLSGKTYTGTIQTIKPSVHISGDEARNLSRTPENMEVVLDEKVFSKEDTQKLEIEVGDFVSFDPRSTITEKGFVKSRYLGI
jgi:putative aminopeptidase FrvX